MVAQTFFGLFKVTVVNSYILYKTTVPHPTSHLQFRHSIVDSLVSRHHSTALPRRVGRPSSRCASSGGPKRLNVALRHFPAKRQQSLQ